MREVSDNLAEEIEDALQMELMRRKVAASDHPSEAATDAVDEMERVVERFRNSSPKPKKALTPKEECGRALNGLRHAFYRAFGGTIDGHDIRIAVDKEMFAQIQAVLGPSRYTNDLVNGKSIGKLVCLGVSIGLLEIDKTMAERVDDFLEDIGLNSATLVCRGQHFGHGGTMKQRFLRAASSQLTAKDGEVIAVSVGRLTVQFI